MAMVGWKNGKGTLGNDRRKKDARTKERQK